MKANVNRVEMQLQSILVENFRGIRRAHLSFGRATVLIGENDCGKARVLEALALVLNNNSEDLLFQGFHFFQTRQDGSGVPPPIRVTLWFRERRKGEWLQTACRPVRSLIGRGGESLRELRLEILATSPNRTPRVRIFSSSETGVGSESREILPWVRAQSPIVRLEQGLIHESGRNGVVRNKEIQSCSDLVDRHYGALLGGHTSNAALDLESGFKAAQALIALSSQHLDAPTRRSNWLLEEIASPTLRFSTYGTSAESAGNALKIGQLLFVGALLRAHAQPFAADAEPIVIFEDPEAHLHPATLASVWSLIERMRWQTIVTTHSGVLLADAPLQSIRRLVRVNDEIEVHQVHERALSKSDIRKFRYHVRSRRGAAMFARCWLLVEGETEFWLLPELARVLGYNFDVEGIACVEFAQCGIPPIVKAARQFGIEWHLLTDGDHSGAVYAATAERFCVPQERSARVTRLNENDIEHCFWASGYSEAIRRIAGRNPTVRPNPRWFIRSAIERSSKPYLALQLLEAVASSGSPGVPCALIEVIEKCVRMARAASSRHPALAAHTPRQQNPLPMEARK